MTGPLSSVAEEMDVCQACVLHMAEIGSCGMKLMEISATEGESPVHFAADHLRRLNGVGAGNVRKSSAFWK